jgi:lipoprotein-anchoring transpeptidase ErfK/SrfK
VYVGPPYKHKRAGSLFTQGVKTTFYAALSVGLLVALAALWRHGKPAPEPAAPPADSQSRSSPASPGAGSPKLLVNQKLSAPASEGRPAASVLEAQIALVREGISPGSIDGASGSQTRSAILAFQEREGFVSSGILTTETKAALALTAPALTEYTITVEDLARLMPAPKTWLEKSQQPRLDFGSILELLGEKSFSKPQLIRVLNPTVDWDKIAAGTTVVVPNVEYPPVADKAAWVRISLADRILEAFDSETNLLVHFPCSIGRLAEKRPAGQLHVVTVALNPNYTFDPEVFPESAEAQSLSGKKLIIPPGPNNPVGVAWIGLDRPGYGIHGTPEPENVGRTESHGCFRLANWNADYLCKLVWVGMPVLVEK